VIFDYDQQPKEYLTACPLCHEWFKQFLSVKTKDRNGYEVTVDTCRKCGLVFLNPRMTPEAYRAFYEDGHYRRSIPGSRGILRSAQEIYGYKLGWMLEPWIDSRGLRTGLDVGGSTGVVAEALQDGQGLSMSVLEPSEAESEEALRRGLTVIKSTLEDWEPFGPFDLVLLCQTVDHLLDISGGLAKIKKCLSEKGIFFVDFVVDSAVKIDHPYYLTKETMRAFLEGAGFRILAEKPRFADDRHYSMVCEVA